MSLFARIGGVGTGQDNGRIVTRTKMADQTEAETAEQEQRINSFLKAIGCSADDVWGLEQRGDKLSFWVPPSTLAKEAARVRQMYVVEESPADGMRVEMALIFSSARKFGTLSSAPFRAVVAVAAVSGVWLAWLWWGHADLLAAAMHK